MRSAIATPTNVAKAVTDIYASGEVPTNERVRELIGGGSFATINKLLKAELERRKAEAAEASALPSDLAKLGSDLGTKIATDIHIKVNEAADARIAEIERHAEMKSRNAEAARDEAIREIERLESELEHTSSLLSSERAAIMQANTRNATLEGRLEEQLKEIARRALDLTISKADERKALDEIATLRAQVAMLEKHTKPISSI